MLKIRWLGHSCVEILGEKHIIIDPDYVIEPKPHIDYICITHGHLDHLGKVLNLNSGEIIASKTVCNLLRNYIDNNRLIEIKPPYKIENIDILCGSSITNETSRWGIFVEKFVRPLFNKDLLTGQLKVEGGQPLAFLIDEGIKIFHDGDGLWRKTAFHKFVDVYCLPCFPFVYNKMSTVIQLVRPRYIIPIHYDVRLGKGFNIKKIRTMFVKKQFQCKLLELRKGEIYSLP